MPSLHYKEATSRASLPRPLDNNEPCTDTGSLFPALAVAVLGHALSPLEAERVQVPNLVSAAHLIF